MRLASLPAEKGRKTRTTQQHNTAAKAILSATPLQTAEATPIQLNGHTSNYIHDSPSSCWTVRLIPTQAIRPVMSRLRAPGATQRSIRPLSGLIRPPQTGSQQTSQTRTPSQNQRPPSQPDHVTKEQQFSFEVGDHVLVGGSKQGIIAFLGSTQFAQGLWAGIVLDVPDGKNDGSVKGVSYFQCSPNHGLFAKVDKLTPLPRQQQPHPPPPTEFRLGDKVIIENGKMGAVAFVGATQFAKGVWVGVTLDTPEGKNNGIVNDVKYFTCLPNHGLFTRPEKLVLAPPINLPSPISTGSSSVDPIELKKKAESLCVGDRVLVNNTKEGILRFIGSTHFAKGIWVGVELDDAQGKNDGAVSGNR